ncbi:hypothetical protein AB4Z17_11735 [Paenibacillus sp. TAF43_2]|uniref:hypothetical protein n=1 Tax=Paenibacillus sp. TAF43_2 TaxID=3233069 RepID=UPI003F976470
MNRKTLEYMEERAKKARAIVDRIHSLTRQAEGLDSATYIEIKNGRRNNVVDMDKRFTHPGNERLFALIVSTTQRLLADEITLLEQELAEL